MWWGVINKKFFVFSGIFWTKGNQYIRLKQDRYLKRVTQFLSTEKEEGRKKERILLFFFIPSLFCFFSFGPSFF